MIQAMVVGRADSGLRLSVGLRARVGRVFHAIII